MLLTDGDPNVVEDLRGYESAVLGVAHAEGIDLGVKLSVASEEVAQDVLGFLLDRATRSDPHSSVRRSGGVFDVVVTRQMKRWHALHTLAVFYRDAFNNQLNDRYKAKFFEYRKLASQAREQTFLFGVGLVLQPLAAAGVAVFDFVAGPIGATTYFGRVSWTNAAGVEGGAGSVTSFDAPAGSVPVVTSLNPPAGATGFHVYLGTEVDLLQRQTSGPVIVGGSFTLPESGLVEGVAPGLGQAPDLYLTGGPVLRRG